MVKLPDPQLFASLAARVDRLIRDRKEKKSMVGHGRMSANTVRRVLMGKNARVSTLIALADALDCDLVIDLQPRPVIDGKVEYPQDVAHER